MREGVAVLGQPVELDGFGVGAFGIPEFVSEEVVGAITVAGASVIHSPLDLPGLLAWWDFTDPAVLFTDAGTTPVASDGDLIYQANDKSGNGYHLTQPTSGKRPVHKEAQTNGRAVARFDAANLTQLIKTGFYNISTNDVASVIVVQKIADQVAFTCDITETVGWNRGIGLHRSGAASFCQVPNGAGGAADLDHYVSPGAGFATHVITWDGPNGIARAFVDGVGYNGGTPTDGLWASGIGRDTFGGTKVYVGARADDDAPLTGDIAEIAIVGGVLSTDEINAIGYALAAKHATTWRKVEFHTEVNATLKGWWDFTDATKLFTDAGTTPVAADGDLIYQAKDKSPNNYDLSQATSGARPAYKTEVVKGHSVARFTDDEITGSVGVGTAGTYFLVMRKRSAPGADARDVWRRIAGAAEIVTLAGWSATDWVWYKNEAGAEVAFTGATATEWAIIGMRHAAADSLVAYCNGVPVVTFDPHDEITTYAGMAIGHVAAGGDYDVAEIVYFLGALTVAEHNFVGQLLARKYGLVWTAVS